MLQESVYQRTVNPENIKILLVILITLTINFTHGQTNTFVQLDKGTNADALVLITDKITFQENNKLDIKNSLLTLDSIVWFLNKQTNTIIQLNILKYKPKSLSPSYMQQSNDQLNEITNYLANKGINLKRLVSAVSYIATGPTDSLVIKTRIRIISHDFADQN